MKLDLNHENDFVGIITVHNAQLYSSSMSEAVDVLCAAMRNSVDRVKAHATMALELLGNKISAEAIKDYEAASRSDPADIGLRILLLGHYSQRKFVSDAARMARQAHILPGPTRFKGKRPPFTATRSSGDSPSSTAM